jgi:hypothetical protein
MKLRWTFINEMAKDTASLNNILLWNSWDKDKIKTN